jgi:TRAP-type mannitol/chloroaromatic compound transport system permease large subunit
MSSARLSQLPRFFTTIFKGVIPFVLTDLLRLLILIAFPMIALWLPGRMV